ncbi:MAG: Gfo/Idh/MocA family oxidoreductase [Pseudomonadota bacterium]
MSDELSVYRHRRDPRFDFLSESDRHAFARPVPSRRLAVIGTGTMGQEHMHVIAVAGRAALHGIFDSATRSIDTALREYAKTGLGPPRVYRSLDEAARDGTIDAFIVCTPNYTHLEVLQTLIKARKPVLVEKPMATTVADAHAMVRLADAHGVPVQVGLQYRFKAQYREAIALALERRVVGEVKMLTLSEHRPPFLDKVGQWNKFADLSGGTLVEKCCHYFDLLNLFAGAKPVSAYAIGGQAVNFKNFRYDNRRADIDDHAVVAIRYENGVNASFTLNMFSPSFSEELVVFGDAGRLCAFEHDDVFANTRSTGLDVDLRPHGARTRSEPRYPAYIEDSGHHGASFHAHLQFCASLELQAGDAASMQDGLWSVAVADAAQRSLASGEPEAVEL